MKAVDYIKIEMEMSKGWIMGLAADMKDSPLTAPTPKGGNHPLWVLGHLTYSEANLLHELIRGEANPLAEWKDIFGQGSEPTDDAAAYPAYEDMLAKYETVRAAVIEYVGSITDDDLEKPSHAPEEMQAFFGTVGQCLAAITVHLSFHGGQLADARRAAGRGVMMG